MISVIIFIAFFILITPNARTALAVIGGVVFTNEYVNEVVIEPDP